jgi:hypothetical protein
MHLKNLLIVIFTLIFVQVFSFTSCGNKKKEDPKAQASEKIDLSGTWRGNVEEKEDKKFHVILKKIKMEGPTSSALLDDSDSSDVLDAISAGNTISIEIEKYKEELAIIEITDNAIKYRNFASFKLDVKTKQITFIISAGDYKGMKIDGKLNEKNDQIDAILTPATK